MNGSEPKTNTTQPSGIDAVGAAIRQGRESRSISRDALAQRLHMGCEQLEALSMGIATVYRSLFSSRRWCDGLPVTWNLMPILWWRNSDLFQVVPQPPTRLRPHNQPPNSPPEHHGSPSCCR